MPILLTHKFDNGTVFITLNRPEVHNALDEELIVTLTKTLDILDKDKNVRAVCLAGSGQHFCAGADLAWMQKAIHYSKEKNIQDAEMLNILLDKLYTFSKPLIVIVRGAAYGGALGLIACADIAIAALDARFCFPEVKLGLIPSLISPYIIKTIGERQAKRYFITSEVFNALDAQKMGLIHEVFPEDKLNAAAEEFLNVILQNSNFAITKAKKLFNRISEKTQKNLAKVLAELRVSQDAQQRLKSFLEQSSQRREK